LLTFFPFFPFLKTWDEEDIVHLGFLPEEFLKCLLKKRLKNGSGQIKSGGKYYENCKLKIIVKILRLQKSGVS